MIVLDQLVTCHPLAHAADGHRGLPLILFQDEVIGFPGRMTLRMSKRYDLKGQDKTIGD